MKFKLSNIASIGLIFSISISVNIANAGLIKNDLEWLDLSLTVGLTVNQVNTTVLNTTAYKDYRYATQGEVDTFWGGIFLDEFNNLASAQWAGLTGLYNTDYSGYLAGAWAHTYVPIGNVSTSNEGTIYFDKHIDGYYIFDIEGTGRNYGSYNGSFLQNEGDMVAFFKTTSLENLSNREVIRNINKDSVSTHYNHMIVRTHNDVPEPSTLAIFSLGLMGLASRRFKINHHRN